MRVKYIMYLKTIIAGIISVAAVITLSVGSASATTISGDGSSTNTNPTSTTASPTPTAPAATSSSSAPSSTSAPTPTPISTNFPYHCGNNPQVGTNINIGCVGKGNPIADMAFAVIRFLSDGVGLILVVSLIIAGIQYATAAGDPQNTAKAIARVRSTLIALLLYIFAYPLLNYLIPKGFFQ